MADIYQVKLIDLLPHSIRNDSKVIAAAEALDAEIAAVTKSIDDISFLARFDYLPSDIIEHLTWQWHVDYFFEDFPPLVQRRQMLKQSIAWHRRKGTAAVVEEVVSSVFQNSKVVEWFKYRGQPYHFMIQIFDDIPDAKMLERLLYLVDSVKNVRSKLEYIVGLSERMLRLNTSGPVATEIIDLSYTERQNHIVFIGSRLSSPGNIETITTDASWSETISYPLFIGPRLNGKTGFKLNKNDITSALNNAPLLARTKTVTNTATTTRKRFVNPAFLLNARGVYTSTMVDVGWDELVTEILFTDGTLNNGKTTVSVTTDTEIKAGTRIDLAGYRLNGKLQEPRLNRSQPVITATTITENKVNTIKRLNASVFSLCSNKTLNNIASYSRQTIVHHPDWQSLIKTEGGHLLNNAPSRTETIETLHPGSKVCKKFNPEIGTVLNGKPSLGYKWKIDLKEAI